MKVAVISDIHANWQAFEATLEAFLEQLDPVLVGVVGHEDVASGLDRLL